jgi:hypothetical protein
MVRWSVIQFINCNILHLEIEQTSTISYLSTDLVQVHNLRLKLESRKDLYSNKPAAISMNEVSWNVRARDLDEWANARRDLDERRRMDERV